jgi:hypothetical protein
MFLLAWVRPLVLSPLPTVDTDLAYSRERFEVALLIQSILMIAAQVREFRSPVHHFDTDENHLTACFTVYLHPLQAKAKS